jgi:hypothetical protein
MNLGDWPVTGVLAVLIIACVTYLAVTKKDVQREHAPEPGSASGGTAPRQASASRLRW